MLIALYKTSGHSMQPIIKDKSFFISSTIPLRMNKLKVGDKIIFKKDNKNIVKIITKIDDSKIFIDGENKFDSKKFSPIRKDEIVGKVIWIF